MSEHDLYVFSSEASYRLQRIIFQSAIERGREVSILYTNSRDKLFKQVETDGKVLGVRTILLDDVVNTLPVLKSRWDMVLPICVHTFPLIKSIILARKTGDVLGLRRVFIRKKRAVQKILHDLRVKAVICSEDGVSGELAIISVAKAMGLPVIDVPYGFGAQQDLENELDQKAKEGRLVVPEGQDFELLKKYAPQWLKRGRHTNVVMLVPGLILAMESLNVTLRDAWIIHGGLSDLLCAENLVGQRQYVNEKIPKEKIALTGSPYCDVIVEALSKNPEAEKVFRQPQKIESGKTRILVSWPPSFHETYPGKNEFETYREMTKVIFTFLKTLPDTTLTVSLHPACRSEVEEFFDELGIPITTQYIINLIPCHDIFSTFFSSTIRWALAAGKPVINYDAYKLGLNAYNDAPGFVNTEDYNSFCDIFKKLVSSERAYAELASKQIENADEWGILDGQCTTRIFAEIDKLTA